MIANTEVLDRVIVGRVTPHIYAFTTNTVPSYLKVGDTYRPVSTRLSEWERHFPGLTKQYEAPATVSSDVYFRDYSVHAFLEHDRQRRRLRPDLLPADTYYSKEFFKDATPSDVADAINDIQRDFDDQEGRYDFYDATTQLPQPFRYERGATWDLRPNQQEAVDNFVKAVNAGRSNLLMYAVMRFGKSFTSLNCAKAINAKTILIVSAKADVRSEWKKTVETAGNFTNWVFIDQQDLARDESILDKARESKETTAIFLTLQDLQGKKLKEKHRQVFSSELDLLIVDETHFGARAEEYGRVLRDAGQATDPVAAQRRDLDDQVNVEDADKQLKQLKPKIRLHLSGTPYRILMGSEFQPEDIISFVQFSDIVNEQEAWDQANLDNDDIDEWDNPYFGFPQMVRFAFNPNESSRKRMAELRKSGINFAFSALLEPQSIKLDTETNLHRKFKHEPEILDLLKVIDGSQQDKNLLGFLDYDKIKEGKMCRHMVMVLPYCASCDAMEHLINTHRNDFKNLGEYKLINISGIEGAKDYKTPDVIKKTIAEAESLDQKTITLTVNRMLTGSTVEQWDTMLYLKDTASPQDYDQAIYRLQNQYTRTLVSAEGKTIKENLKPQTLLVDFDPARMFHMQEQKSLIYNVNTDHSGNDKRKERLREELRISPIITINHNRIHQVEATNILDAVSAYNNNRSIADEARDIPVDLGLLDNGIIREVIESQAEIGSRQGLSINPVEGDEVDLDIEDQDPQETDTENVDKPDKIKPAERHDDDIRSLEKKLQTYYQRILFFAMLTNKDVRSLVDVIDVIKKGDDNKRIAMNLGLDPHVLWEIVEAFDPFKLSALDYKIQNISQLGRDESLPPIERATRALEKFSRISDSEVRTPQWLCNKMLSLIPGDELEKIVREGGKILDIASKSGEFAVAVYQRLTKETDLTEDIAKQAIYSIPTSSITYEFTRLFYEILGLNTKNISSMHSTYDLLNKAIISSGEGKTKVTRPCLSECFSSISSQEGKSMKFDAIIGNPPYQSAGGSGGTNDSSIYQDFVQLALDANPRYVSMIIKSQWFSGGRENLIGEFRKRMLSNRSLKVLHDFANSRDIFPDVEIKGGICYFLIDSTYNGDCDTDLYLNGEHYPMSRDLRKYDVYIRHPLSLSIVEKVKGKAEALVSDLVSSDTPFGIPTNPQSSRKTPFHVAESKTPECQTVLFYNDRNVRKRGYVALKDIKKNAADVGRPKAVFPKTGWSGNDPHVLGEPLIAPPNSVCSQTYLYAAFDTQEEVENFIKYYKTRFFRFLVSVLKITQDAMKRVYRYVPVQDFTNRSNVDWSADVDSLDNQLFTYYGLDSEEVLFIRRTIEAMD